MKSCRDPLPRLRPAGVVPKCSDSTAYECVHADTQGKRPTTPNQIKKYRQSYRNQPGIRIIHYGLQEDAKNLDMNCRFGRTSVVSDPVNVVIKAQNLNGLADKFNDIMESKYASQQMEPLGRPVNREYNWPKSISENRNFKFGVKSKECENAKDILFPALGAKDEKPEFAKMYEKTHGNI